MNPLAVFYAAYFAFIGLYSPYFGPYLKSVGHSVDTIGWALALMQSMRMIGPQAWGWLADHTNRRVRWLRVGSALGLVCAALLFLHVEQAVWVLIFAVLLNSALSGLVPLSDAYAMLACRSDLGRYGKLRLWGSIGFIVSVLGFGQWASHHGLEAYPVSVMFCLGITGLSALLMKEHQGTEKHSTDAKASFLQLFASADICFFWLTSFCAIAAHGALYGFYSLYLQDHGYSTDIIGGMWALGVIAEVIFFWFQGRFFSRLSVARWLQWSMLAATVRFALLAVYPDALWLVASIQLLHALTFAANHSAAMLFLKQHCDGQLLARGQALYTGISYGLGGFLGTALAGRLWVWFNPAWAFWMAAGFSALAFVFAGGMGYFARSRVVSTQQ